MKFSRREFVGNATASAGGLCFFRASGWNAAGRSLDRQSQESRSAILDAGSDCLLRESLQGYEAALGEQSTSLSGDGRSWQGCRSVIVPGIGALQSDTASLLIDVLDSGGQVLLESGTGFLRAAEFSAHQNMLQRFFGIAVDEPVDLWAENESVPYVKYEWPCEAMVRDFSRAVSVSGEPGEIIGKVGTLPVALRRQMANGAMIFLGSPLGPALGAGDPEALAWFRSLTRV